MSDSPQDTAPSPVATTTLNVRWTQSLEETDSGYRRWLDILTPEERATHDAAVKRVARAIADRIDAEIFSRVYGQASGELAINQAFANQESFGHEARRPRFMGCYQIARVDARPGPLSLLPLGCDGPAPPALSVRIRLEDRLSDPLDAQRRLVMSALPRRGPRAYVARLVHRCRLALGRAVLLARRVGRR